MNSKSNKWKAPELPATIDHGDMPGDKVSISGEHIKKSEIIFPVLAEKLEKSFKENPFGKTVISIYGGSGVGKSEIASVLAYFLKEQGIKGYILSGDNYPHRIPEYNDAERLRIFREEGYDALCAYLGSEKECNFTEVNDIIRQFKKGAEHIWMKRMGRRPEELWYELVDVKETQVLLIEWTHGNNALLSGIDVPVFLFSTPEETLAHRKKRNRDKQTDSPFTTLVLTAEQTLLESQAEKAAIILSKDGT